MVPQSRNSATLIPAHQAGISDYVCVKDRRQTALISGHGMPSPNRNATVRRILLRSNFVTLGVDVRHVPYRGVRTVTAIRSNWIARPIGSLFNLMQQAGKLAVARGQRK